MAPLLTLLITFAIARIALRPRRDRALAGRIALAALLVVTGVSHFVQTEALTAMVPPVFPEPVLLVYLTGVLELGFAAALLLRPSRRLGFALAAFFIALLPANVYSAVAEVGLGGHGAAYLWFRVPLQALFIAWALRSTRDVVDFRRDASPA
jgi:uncharacterized membrane protein